MNSRIICGLKSKPLVPQPKLTGAPVIISRVLKKVRQAVSGQAAPRLNPVVIPRAEHTISRDDISENALKVLYRLNKAGFDAYLVGGCVRDLMLGLHPKDFDVVTNATPEEIKAQFRNCRLIGRRFRLAHIVFGREIIEVATFRGHHDNDAGKDLSHQGDHGQLLRDNVFGSIEEDAERRDFTINAMYYNIADFSVTDFANGVKAIKQRRIELLGDPETRYREDPVRMLRAVRFAAKLNMQISERSGRPIRQLGHLLNNVPPARLFEEVIKLLISGRGVDTFEQLISYDLFSYLFPHIAPQLNDQNSREYRFVQRILANTDNRINTDQRVTPAFTYAAMLWYPVEERTQQLMFESGLSHHDAFNIAMNDVLTEQIKRIMIPKRFTTSMREMWQLQYRLPKRFGRRAYQLLAHPRFRAAYDFLLVRAEVEGGELEDLAQWWTDFQDASNEQRKDMLNELRQREGGRAPSRRRRPRRRKPSSSGQNAQ